MTGFAHESETFHSEGPAVGRGGVTRPLLLAVASIAVLQFYYFLAQFLSALGDWVAYALVPGALLVVLALWLRGEPRGWARFGWVLYERPTRTLGMAALLIVTYLVLELEAGLFVGLSVQVVPSPPIASLLFVTAPLIALSRVGIFYGYVFRKLADRWTFSGALAVSSAMFALASTNLSILPILSWESAGAYVFLDGGTAFALGIVLGVYLCKSRWSLLGPVALQTLLLLATYFSPWALGSASWEIVFVVELFAYSAMLMLVVVLVREPGYLARRYFGKEFGAQRYRFLRRERSRRGLRQTVVVLAVVLPVVLAGVVSLQTWSGVRTPVLAIASGSMAPTLARGDLVLIQHVTPEAIVVGTIVAYSSSCLPAPTVHRVVAVTSTAAGPVYETQGDANPSPDPCPVPYSEVLGKVMGSVPDIGFLLLQPALLVGILALGVSIPYVLPRRGQWPLGSSSW